MKEIDNIGFYFENFFEEQQIFEKITRNHTFQSLTESNKIGNAYRKGLYISNVKKIKEEYTFNLLRCSTNFRGPTENFKDIDKYILQKVNDIRKQLYPSTVELNHVLAQIYYNHIINNKEKKAKIKEHSDKTKDMPLQSVMAFCTFYKETEMKLDERAYTTLRFRLKNCVTEPDYTKTIDIILHPNSLLLIPLSTNRLYTHEIIPSKLNVSNLPTRMGYVIRSSNTEATHKNGKTYIGETQLEQITEKDIIELRSLYLLENTSDKIVNYPNTYFSMNSGDYLQPIM